MRTAWLAAAVALLLAACAGRGAGGGAHDLESAAESYVRLALTLGERDADSLDSYHGPREWRDEARTRQMPLADVQQAARSLADTLASSNSSVDDVRREFLMRQLRSLAARVDVLRGARAPFAEEARALFGPIHIEPVDQQSAQAVRASLERLLPGSGDLPARYAAFERGFLIPADRLAPVLARAVEGCRAATARHVALPPGERVEVEYVRDSPWSAFTRYEGHFVSRVQVNAGLPLTVDRALDLACHEAYPGHHTIDSLFDARFSGRVELFVHPLFSPQSLLHEAASSTAGALAFPGPARAAFERDELFPLAGLDPAGAARHEHVARLVDQLHGVEGDIARRYIDGELDFARASTALEREAVMPSADATLKFLNQFRTYAATYTYGRDQMARHLGLGAGERPDTDRWRAYVDAVTDPAQVLPPPKPASGTTDNAEHPRRSTQNTQNPQSRATR